MHHCGNEIIIRLIFKTFCFAFNFGLLALGVIQQLRGQEEGEGGHPKVHACPPWGEP